MAFNQGNFPFNKNAHTKVEVKMTASGTGLGLFNNPAPAPPPPEPEDEETKQMKKQFMMRTLNTLANTQERLFNRGMSENEPPMGMSSMGMPSMGMGFSSMGMPPMDSASMGMPQGGGATNMNAANTAPKTTVNSQSGKDIDDLLDEIQESDAKDVLSKVHNEVGKLKLRIDKYKNGKSDPQYARLEEGVANNQKLIKTIDIKANPEMAPIRKLLIKEIQELEMQLEDIAD